MHGRAHGSPSQRTVKRAMKRNARLAHGMGTKPWELHDREYCLRSSGTKLRTHSHRQVGLSYPLEERRGTEYVLSLRILLLD
jgi:hypothetical protein